MNSNITQLGVDIGSSGIRAVVLRGTGGGAPQLITYGEIAVDPKISSSDSPADVQKVSQAVGELTRKLGVGNVNVVAGISGNEGFASVVTMPAISEKEVGGALELQSDKYFPLPIDEINYDWQIVGKSPDGKNMSVFVASAPKKVSEKTARVIEGAGLRIDAIEVNPLASTRSLATDQPMDNTAMLIVDIGHSNTEITLVQNQAPLFVRVVNSGLQTFVRAAAQNLNLDNEQATQFVNKFGVVKTKLEGQVYKAIKGPVDSILSDMNRALKYFATQNEGLNVTKIVATGAGCNVPDLPLSIANTLNLPVEIGNPWKSVSYAAAMQDQLLSVSSTFAVAAGLARRGLQ